MDVVSLLRTLGGLGVVLGILAGALWVVRRFDLRLPGRAVGARERRLELVETLPIDSRRMVALVRRDGREHLVLIAPEGHLILESAVVRDATDAAAADARRTAQEDANALRDAQRERRRPTPDSTRDSAVENFATLIERAERRADLAMVLRCAVRLCTNARARARSWAEGGSRSATIAWENAAALGAAVVAARATASASPYDPVPPPSERAAPMMIRIAAPSSPPAPAAVHAPAVEPGSKRARRRQRFHQEIHLA